MKNIYYPVTAEIALQGDEALVLNHLTQELASYEIIGFENPKITILDFRRVAIEAITRFLENREITIFSDQFNTPADVIIEKDKDQNFIIRLLEPSQPNSKFILWVAIGINEYLPVFPYEFCQLCALSNGKFAVASLFQLEPEIQSQ